MPALALLSPVHDPQAVRANQGVELVSGDAVGGHETIVAISSFARTRFLRVACMASRHATACSAITGGCA